MKEVLLHKGPQLPNSLQPVAFFIYADTVKAKQELKMATITGTYLRLGKMFTPCHTSESLGGVLMANNLLNKNQTAPFKMPSLIKALTTASYMHNGSMKNTATILKHYDKHIHLLHKVNTHLGLDAIPNIFTNFDPKNFDNMLEIFTDLSIILNPTYSNPFAKKDFSWQQQINE
mgnify:CR=1 FL=1